MKVINLSFPSKADGVRKATKAKSRGEKIIHVSRHEVVSI
jgi:hypothetical protein